MRIFTSAAFKDTTISFTMDQEYKLKPKYTENSCCIQIVGSYENSLVPTRWHFPLLPSKVHKYILISKRAGLQFRLWATSISHCQGHSACPLKVSSDEKKNAHCQDNSVLLFIDSGLLDIFLSRLNTCWTEWEITLYLELTKALDIYSAWCNQLDQISGADYSEREKFTCFLPETTVYIMLKMPDLSQKDHRSSNPQLGSATSLQASSARLLLWLSRKPI